MRSRLMLGTTIDHGIRQLSRIPHRNQWLRLALCAMVVGCSARGGSPDGDAAPATAPVDGGTFRNRGVVDEGGVPNEGGTVASFGSDPFQRGDASTPETPAQCPPGTYEGSFECDFVPSQFDGGSTYPVSGSLTITFEKASRGEFLEVVDGKLEATADVFFGMRAGLNGELQCGNGKFEATTEDGIWALGDPSMPIAPGGTFQTDLSGMLSGGSAPTIEGGWSLDEPMLGHCEGTWSVQKTP